MNPHHTPGSDGSGFGMPPQGPPGVPPQGYPPQGPPPPGAAGQPPQGPPPRPGRYGAGVVSVLVVIAFLAGSAFVGGGLAVGHVVTSSFVEEEPEPEPTEEPTEEPTPSPTPSPTPTPTEEPEPTEEPTLEPEDMLTAEEAVNELRRDFDIGARADSTDEYCTSDEDEEESLFQCTSAMDTDLVRVIAFETAGAAMFTAMALENDEEGDAVDVQDACHLVLIWFEQSGMEQDERDEMVALTENAAACS